VQEITYVQSTTDYRQFKLAEANRRVRHDRVDRIAAEIKAGNNLLSEYPILVFEEDGHLVVKDGQHRLAAAEQAGVPIHYLVSKNRDIASIIAANLNTAQWELEDYLDYYRHLSPDYSKLHRLWQKYPFFTLSVLLSVFAGEGGRPLKRFREGDLVYETRGAERVDEMANILDDLSEYYDFWQQRSFVLAVNAIARHPDYNHSIMMKRHERKRIDKQATKVDYIDALLAVYNYGTAYGNRLYMDRR
jgi:hypothetical protein